MIPKRIIKKFFINFLVTAGLSSCGMNMMKAEKNINPEELYSTKVKYITGVETSLDIYRGKVLLIVNSASKCGFTPQYGPLEKLYEKYKDQDFVVLAFPSNDFGKQEPGSNEEIKNFCENKFNITFPMFEKNPVTGKDIQPVFKYLTQNSGSRFEGEVDWNFEKFIVDRKGLLRDRFSSFTSPDSERIEKLIIKLLAEPK